MINPDNQIELKEKNNAKKKLIEIFKPLLKKRIRPTLYTICKHVSASGMMRHIDVLFISKGEIIKLNYLINKLGLFEWGNSQSHNSDSLRVSGCGMDMGFHVVYELGEFLWNTSADCSKLGIVIGRNGDKKPETEGGYILNQRWL